jgi:subtilisin family serine protease
MSKLSRAIAMVIGTVGFAVTAQAATYVVTAKTQNFDQQLARKIEAAGGTVTARLPQIGVAIVESNQINFVSRAAKTAGIRSVVEDYVIKFDIPEAYLAVNEDFTNPPASGDNDTRFDLQWGSAAIDVAGAWNQGYRGQGATVAVLDSGILCQHADIAANLLPDSTSFVAGENVCHNIAGSFNHGTHVAGIIAAPDNAFGTIGVAPQAKILAVKVLSGVTGSGSFGGIIQGIVYAADHGADVINMSLGVSGGLQVNGRGANQVAELINATKRAVQYARAQNALTIVAAGNDGMDLDHSSGVEICDTDGCYRANLSAFPAELPNVLTVSATSPVGWAANPAGSLDYLASYSSYGQSAISFAAPGGDTPTYGTPAGSATCTVGGLARPCYVFDLVFAPGGFTPPSSNGYYWAAGTSMATPHVSGVAALIIGKHGGEMAPSEVERILRASSDDVGKPGNDAEYGGGRVNASRAVSN